MASRSSSTSQLAFCASQLHPFVSHSSRLPQHPRPAPCFSHRHPLCLPSLELFLLLFFMTFFIARPLMGSLQYPLVSFLSEDTSYTCSRSSLVALLVLLLFLLVQVHTCTSEHGMDFPQKLSKT